MSLKIMDGQFVEDGKPVKAEFGNLAQIEVLKRNNDLARALTEGMDVISSFEHLDEDEDRDYLDEPYTEHKLQIKCPCGRTPYEKMEGLGEYPIDIWYRGETKIKCRCGRAYEASIVEEYTWNVKLVQ
jgi:hypothetical protein